MWVLQVSLSSSVRWQHAAGVKEVRGGALSTPSVLTALTNCWCISTDHTTRAFFALPPSPSLSPLRGLCNTYANRQGSSALADFDVNSTEACVALPLAPTIPCSSTVIWENADPSKTGAGVQLYVNCAGHVTLARESVVLTSAAPAHTFSAEVSFRFLSARRCADPSSSSSSASVAPVACAVQRCRQTDTAFAEVSCPPKRACSMYRHPRRTTTPVDPLSQQQAIPTAMSAIDRNPVRPCRSGLRSVRRPGRTEPVRLRRTTCCHTLRSSSMRTGLIRKSTAPCVTPRSTVLVSPLADITGHEAEGTPPGVSRLHNAT